MIVTQDQQDAAMVRRTRRISVAQRIARSVNAGPFSVPHGKDTVVLPLGVHTDLLGAHYSRGRQVLVDGGQEGDVVFGQELL